MAKYLDFILGTMCSAWEKQAALVPLSVSSYITAHEWLELPGLTRLVYWRPVTVAFASSQSSSTHRRRNQANVDDGKMSQMRE